jgi:UDP-N-acetylmuramate: L-alanyl-gamma-D-glutamyl-meso-diaminopimelate ligase
LVYYRDDEVLRRLIRKKNRPFKLIPYSTPEYSIVRNRYYLHFFESEIPLRLFGQHNMQNIAGAIEVLRLLGLKDTDILAAIESFEGASNRLEKMYDENKIRVYKDFAHSPSKLKSTTTAVHELYPDQLIIACFELHTYSSLNKDFLNEYGNAFQHGNEKIVFVNDHTLQIKKMPPLSDDLIKKGFNDKNIRVIRSLLVLEKLLSRNIRPNSVFLFMSSGNFGGLDYSKLINSITRHQLN